MAEAEACPRHKDADGPARFHLQIEAAYVHANQTLLKLLVQDQDLMSHLRSVHFCPHLPDAHLRPFSSTGSALKQHLFLSESSFITHFLDLSLFELSKSSRSASASRLQSLLDITLRTPGSGVADTFKEDAVKVVIATERVYELLNKIISQSGDMGVEGYQVPSAADRRREADKKKELFGSSSSLPLATSERLTREGHSVRGGDARLHGRLPGLARHLAPDHDAVPDLVSAAGPAQARRDPAGGHVDGPHGGRMSTLR